MGKAKGNIKWYNVSVIDASKAKMFGRAGIYAAIEHSSTVQLLYIKPVTPVAPVTLTRIDIAGSDKPFYTDNPEQFRQSSLGNIKFRKVEYDGYTYYHMLFPSK